MVRFEKSPRHAFFGWQVNFPSGKAAAKLIWLALNATSTEWGHPARAGYAVKNQFAIIFEHRFLMAWQNPPKHKMIYSLGVNASPSVCLTCGPDRRGTGTAKI